MIEPDQIWFVLRSVNSRRFPIERLMELRSSSISHKVTARDGVARFRTERLTADVRLLGAAGASHSATRYSASPVV